MNNMPNLNIFPDDLLEKMINSVIDSNKIDQEIEFNLCTNDVNCEENQAETIGSFHVYPKEKRAEHHTKDMILGYKYGIACVGAIDEIVCMIRKEDYRDDIYQQMQEIKDRYNYLYKISDELSQVKDKFLETKIKSGDMHIVEISLDIEDIEMALEIAELPGIILPINPRIPLGQFILPINVIQKMKDLIIESEKIGKEMGFDLCVNSDNMIIVRNECIGDENCAATERKCKIGEIFIGIFHTHSHRAKMVKISLSDLITIYRDGIGCIGAREEMKCFLRYDFNKNEYEFLENLYADTELINKEIDKTSKEKIEFGKKHFEEVILWRRDLV